VIFLHAGYVVVEAVVLCWMAQSSRQEADQSMDIMQVTQSISGAEHIDLTSRSTLDSPVSRSFNEVLGNLEQLVRETRHSPGGLNDSGHHLATLTQHMHDVADLQKRETEQVAAAVEQMSAAIRQVAHNAEEASAAAHRADSSAQLGKEGSVSMGCEIDNLAEKILEHIGETMGVRGAPWTAQAPLPGGDFPDGDLSAFATNLRAQNPFLSEALARRLARSYG